MRTKTFALGCLVPLAVVLALMWFIVPIVNDFTPLEPWSVRKVRFGLAAKRAEPLLAAIRKYESEHGHPPESVSELLPKYVQRVPGTGLPDYPKFEYYSFTNSRASLVWYDLGSRHGKPATGLWVYPDGDSDHAIVAFTLDRSNRVVDARVDRMPGNYDPIEFDRDMWLARSNRIEMIRTLPGHHNTEGISRSELQSVLGTPDGDRILLDSPWEVRINCSRGMMNWDVFFYWPTTNYPKHIYGGEAERIGDWAYVHE
jgi:hypothetical protein